MITCSGTIGKVLLVPKHWDGWAASQHMIRIVAINKELAGYMSIFLSTDYGKELILRNVYGSVIDEIDDEHIRKMKIPILKDFDAQKSIGEMALKANDLRYEAYCKEKRALDIMNNEILV